MRNLELSWQQAAVLAGCLVVVTVLLPLARRPRLTAAATFTRETALVLALFTLWQFAGSFSVMGPGGALGRGRWIWHLERVMYLPSETSVQRLFLPHPVIVQALNLYYDALHFPVLIACLIWLWVRHRARYTRVRTTLAVFTAACLLIQLVPVAPPRMLPATGLVDTAVLYHQSVYQTHPGFDPDQLSAMPSVHVGWAILVAIMVITTARSRWRWLAAGYPVATTLAVVATANHYWLDGIVAGLLLALVLLVQHAVRRLAARSTSLRLLPYRPATDHSRNGTTAGTGSSNGRNGAAPDHERTRARCDRSSLGPVPDHHRHGARRRHCCLDSGRGFVRRRRAAAVGSLRLGGVPALRVVHRAAQPGDARLRLARDLRGGAGDRARVLGHVT